ncbi:MAG: DUF2380 domain-containing protein [Methylovulum sp.]|uniref:DUF2380 domain-containing protein n=1 Tax=Methylovulum sp. TaxID=1916980 RepID=UPI002601B330|nr:DUF2380 domain-containing protein [Methylovulum sp.]MDD2722911.1 DUF2380 domain-containing protein [Methylovulum sp.]MDD5125880.1 DUF2380 domain-containing protein [Methylovulum sp.]
MNRLISTLIVLVILLLSGNKAYAAPRIAILAFELNDITSLPNTPQEKIRTASIQPLLEQALKQSNSVEIIHIPPATQAAANSGLGYLFHFHELAAQLGGQAGADWLVVGQHSKPSFLYSYLMAQVINVKTRNLVASFAIELKGNHASVTEHGVNALAKKINGIINPAR